MDEFEGLLKAEQVSIERFVRYTIGSKADADDFRDVTIKKIPKKEYKPPISIEIGKAGKVKVSALDPDKAAFGKAVRMTSDGTLAFEGLGLNKWEEKVFVIK